MCFESLLVVILSVSGESPREALRPKADLSNLTTSAGYAVECYRSASLHCARVSSGATLR